MRPLAVISAAALAALASCSGGGDGGGTGPQTGTVQINTVTTGVDVDADGYTYSVDGGTPVPISSTASASVTAAPGSHTVAFSGLAGNCTASTPMSFTFTLTGGHTQNVDFGASCQARYSVLAATTGADQDIAYLVAVDAGPWHLALANGPAAPLPGTGVGAHTLHIAGVAPNCLLSGSASRPITVIDGVQSDPISVTCSATTRTILFTSTRNGGSDIYIMNADGTAQTRISNGSVPLAHSRWSPDGSKIVSHGWTTASAVDIYVVNADGTGLTQLTTDGNSNLYPDWSPDGSQIVWQKNFSIWVMDANGANPHRVQASGAGPRWSPDGSRIAFVDLVSVDVIKVMDADGNNVITLQPSGTGPNVDWPSWSPDGKKLLFASLGDIFSMNADGTGAVNLNVLGGGDPAEYSPNGQSIAFTAYDASSSQDIFKMDANGMNAVDLVSGSPNDFAPAWHP